MDKVEKRHKKLCQEIKKARKNLNHQNPRIRGQAREYYEMNTLKRDIIENVRLKRNRKIDDLFDEEEDK